MTLSCRIGMHRLDWSEGTFGTWDAYIPCMRCSHIATVDAHILTRFRRDQEARLRLTLSEGNPLSPTLSRIIEKSLMNEQEALHKN